MDRPSAVLLPPAGQRILFVLAHPDDAEFLCGGTVALLAKEGRDLHYLLVTHGEKGSDEPAMTPERLAAIRELEQRRAAQFHHKSAGDPRFQAWGGMRFSFLQRFELDNMLCL